MLGAPAGNCHPTLEEYVIEMSTSRRWSLILGTAALAATVAVGCGGDEPQNGTSSTGGGGDATTTSTTGSSSGGGQDGAGGAGQGGSGGAGQGGGQGGAGEGGAGGGGQGGSGQGGSASTSDSLDVNGKLTPGAGKSVPPAADVIIGWSVSSGSPDYIYGFGSGNSTGVTFQVSLDKAPPTEALNVGKVGVGIVILYPAGMMPPEGKLTEATLNQGIGAAGEYAIIYKAPGAPSQSWISKFPEGYSCGKGAPPEPGSNFESFAPVDCSEITIIVDDIDKIDFVNWT